MAEHAERQQLLEGGDGVAAPPADLLRGGRPDVLGQQTVDEDAGRVAVAPQDVAVSGRVPEPVPPPKNATMLTRMSRARRSVRSPP